MVCLLCGIMAANFPLAHAAPVTPGDYLYRTDGARPVVSVPRKSGVEKRQLTKPPPQKAMERSPPQRAVKKTPRQKAVKKIKSKQPNKVALQEQPSSDVIRDVIIRGNQRIADDTILNYSGIQRDEKVDDGRINQALKKLYESGLFADVSILFESPALVIEVQENPIINRISFEGNEDIKDETLEQEVGLVSREVFSRDKVQQATQRIIVLYRRSGRFSATVIPKIIELPENRVNLVFEIREGGVTRVAKISFIGNIHFSDPTLLDHVSTQEEHWYRFFSTDDIYDPDRLRYDRELLRLFYLKNGYVDFKVLSTSADLSPNRKSFYITFVVEEGERYKVADVGVEVEIPELEDVDFRQDITTQPGDWYNAEEVSNNIATISDHTGRYGYAFVDIEPEIKRDKAKQTVNILFRIRQGEKVYVERVNISGNKRTEDQVIRRDVLLYEGDAFNVAKLRRSRRMLQQLGLFAKIDVNNRPGSRPDQTIIDINVSEQSTGSLSLGGGYSTSDGALGNVRIQEKNFLGRGQDVTVGFTLSQRRQNIDLNFVEPYLMGYPVAGGIGAYYVDRDYKDESGYVERITGGRLSASYWLWQDLREQWIYSIYRDEITDILNTASNYIKSQKGARITSSITHVFSYDKRNDYVYPTDGYYADFSTTFAGVGGDTKYLRLRSVMKYYYTLVPKWTTMATVRSGYIQGVFGKEVRLSDRFFIGGDDFRGFHISGIGPRDKKTTSALGGNIYYVAQVEQAFPLGLPEELGIEGRVFADAGSLFDIDLIASDRSNRGDIVDSNSLRVSAGAGIAWNSPFGQVRIYYAEAIKKESYDVTESIRFSFGTNF